MEMRKVARGAGAVLLFAGLAVAPAWAQGDQQGAQQQPPMSAEEQAMHAAWQKAMTPGPQHQALARMAGDWEFQGKFWMGGADKPPMEATGTLHRTMILGGRVLAEEVKSHMMGQPFEGHGMTGFDNVTQKYWSTFNDNMGTGIMIGTGACDAQGVCTFMNEYSDPLTGKTKKSRSVMRHEGDKEVFEMYDTGADGKEYKSMELVSTRKKS